MKTRILMVSSALFMAIPGLAASFLPQEILAFSGLTISAWTVLAVQVAGGLYLGFAMLNWMARANLIGGIYSRPVAIGNFLHFAMVTLAAWKAVAAGQSTIGITLAAIIYSVFAIAFGWVAFTQPRVTKP